MILSDTEIKRRIQNGEIGFESLGGTYSIMEQIGPTSIDFRLGPIFKIYTKSRKTCIDTKIGVDPDHVETITLQEGDSFILHPGDFVLGASLEKINYPLT